MGENIDLVSNPKESFWKLSIPIIAFSIFNAVYGIVDMVWVSKISVEAFFAIGVSIPVVSLIYSIGITLGQGTNSLMSRFIGSEDYESANNTLVHGVLLSNVFWVVMVLCLLFAQGILFYIDKADSYILILDYLVPFIIFAYIFIFTNLLSQTLQAEGNSTLPTILIIVSNVLNIILDPIFIFNLDLGVRGAAYASVVSASVAFIVLLFYYTSGRTKIPLSLKSFKFHSYIFSEIFKVALPNILENTIWTTASTFINYVLIATMGEVGPILYSIWNKIDDLFLSVARGNSNAFLSITGHLFGAKKFDEMRKMFHYVLKITLAITFVIMVIFFIFRDYVFSLFSITGMETEIFWIAIGGTIFILGIVVTTTSSRVLDGFGKSIYTLIISFVQCILEVGIMFIFFKYLNSGISVIIGMASAQVIAAIAYYYFIEYLIKTFNKKYDKKSTVKNFNDETEDIDDKIDEIVEDNARKLPPKVPLITILIAMGLILIQIISIPIKTQNYGVIFSGVAILIISVAAIILMEKLKRPNLAVIAIAVVSIIIYFFMGAHGYLAVCLYIIAGILIFSMNRIIKKLKELI